MATERSIPAGVQRELEVQHSQEVYLVFLEIDQVTLSDKIRVVSDPKDHVWGGNTFTGVPFQITILEDTDQAPRAQLSIQNADRTIGKAIKAMENTASVDITVIAGSEFDDTVDPRTEVGTASVTYQATNLILRDVEVDAQFVSGVLAQKDLSREQWPAVVATQDRLPGVFR